MVRQYYTKATILKAGDAAWHKRSVLIVHPILPISRTRCWLLRRFHSPKEISDATYTVMPSRPHRNKIGKGWIQSIGGVQTLILQARLFKSIGKSDHWNLYQQKRERDFCLKPLSVRMVLIESLRWSVIIWIFSVIWVSAQRFQKLSPPLPRNPSPRCGRR